MAFIPPACNTTSLLRTVIVPLGDAAEGLRQLPFVAQPETLFFSAPDGPGVSRPSSQYRH